MSAKPETAKVSRPTSRRIEHIRVRYRAPFNLRCGAILIDYIVLALILTFSTLVARLMGGGARLAGGTAENIGIIFTLVAAVLDLGVLAGLTGKTLGKWTTGLRLETTDANTPGIGRALLRHFIGYPVSFLFFGLGFLLAIVNPTGRALHDLIAGTVVIREYGGTAVTKKSAPKNVAIKTPSPSGRGPGVRDEVSAQ